MTLQELVATMQESGPAAVRKLDPELLAKVARAAFAAVARSVEAAPDGKHKVDGLGIFQVRTVEPDPQANKKGGRRVLFVARPPKPKAGKA